MPLFRYTALSADGGPVSGELEAADADEAAARLTADGMTVQSVAPVEEPAAPVFDDEGREVTRMSVPDFRRLSGHLGDLTEAGLPLVQGLSALAQELPHFSRFRRGLESIIRQLEAGRDLQQVLAGHGAPADLQALIAAGAKTGHVGELLGRYAAESRQVSDMKLQVAMALAYPAIVFVAVCALLASILGWIVPMFRKIFEDFGTELPALTTLLMTLSNLLARFGVPLLILSIVLAGAVWLIAAFAIDKVTRRRMIYRIPVVGRLLRYGALARFSNLLATLIESGVTLPQALVLSGESSGDAEIHAASWAMAADVEAGEPPDEAAAKAPSMPATLVEVLRWHQQPGLFADALRALSAMYEAQARSQSCSITILWPPVIILTLGTVLGFTVIALFLPLIKLLNDLT